jgi:hypothetical protein
MFVKISVNTCIAWGHQRDYQHNLIEIRASLRQGLKEFFTIKHYEKAIFNEK